MNYELWEDAIKLFDDYSSIVSDAKYKTIHGKGHPSDLAHVAKVFDRTQLKILFSK